MLNGETVMSTNNPCICSDCGEIPTWGVYRSNAGYYVGTYCHCGPYSRESEYFRTQEAATVILNSVKSYFNEART